MAKYFYCRVSTADGKQDFDRQLHLLHQRGIEVDKIFSDKITGKTMKRPGWDECMKTMKEGDTLIVSELARLSRVRSSALTTMDELTQRGIFIISLKEEIDLSTPIGRAFAGIIAVLAQLERESIVERVRDGVAAAQARGVKFGVPKDEQKRAKIREAVTSPDWHGSMIRTARELEVNPRTVKRVVEELECAV